MVLLLDLQDLLGLAQISGILFGEVYLLVDQLGPELLTLLKLGTELVGKGLGLLLDLQLELLFLLLGFGQLLG